VGSPLTEPLHHSTWATLRLTAFVRDLPPQQRAWSSPGTYGPIDQTLAHLVGAEQYYVFRLTGERPAVELTKRSEVDLDDLAERVRWCGARLDDLMERGFDENAPTHPHPPDRRMPTLGEMIAQLLWHGAEHRTQVTSTLGAHGIEPPDASGWAYAGETRTNSRRV
jgi:uncharacterized damage-inducible protein DinB